MVDSTEDGPAWERRSELGFFKALFTTWKEVLFNPGVTFGRMKSSGGFGSPLLFHLIMTIISFVFVSIYQFIQMALIGTMVASSGSSWDVNVLGVVMAGGGVMVVVWFIIAIPVMIGINFINAGIVHLCLCLFKGTSKPYKATYRILCFASSAFVFTLIPCVGSMAASVWVFVAQIIGLTRVHKTEGWRVACAILLPVIVCLGFFIALYGVIFAMLLSKAYNGFNN